MLEEDDEREETTQHAFRFPHSLVERIDLHVERMRGQRKGVTFTRADAVRSLLCDRLDDVERYEREEGERKDERKDGRNVAHLLGDRGRRSEKRGRTR